MRSSIAILLIALVVCNATTVPSWVYDTFDHWCTKYNKMYDSPTERNYRVSIFYDNLQFIHSSNSETTHYTLALNQFADLTTQEFSEMYLGAVVPTNFTPKTTFTYTKGEVPATVDWVT